MSVGHILYNLPVRRKIFMQEPKYKSYNTVREDLLQLLIHNPHIKMKMEYTDEYGRRNMLLNYTLRSVWLEGADLYSYVFRNVFGPVIPANTMKAIRLKGKGVLVTAAISKFPVRLKDFQFLFINRRKYINSTILKEIKSLFRQVAFGSSSITEPSIKSVGKPYNAYPVFIIDVECTSNIDDLIQSPSKDIIRPTLHEVIDPMIKKIVTLFLKSEGYSVPETAVNKEEQEQEQIQIPRSMAHEFSTKSNSLLTSKSGFDSKIKMAKYIHKDPTETINPILRSPNKVTKKAIKRLPRPLSSNNQKSPNKRRLKTPISTNDCWLDIPNVISNSPNKGLIESDLMAYQLTSSILKDCTIINQVDDKFILLKTASSQDRESVLLIVDQHACDERIKLESYLKDFFQDVINGTISSQPLWGIEIDVNFNERALFEAFRTEFQEWGIVYQVSQNFSGRDILMLQSLPTLLNSKANGDIYYLKKVLLQHVYDLQNFKRLKLNRKDRSTNETNISKFDWWKYINCIPKVFQEIFNSKACRSAIMFGDKLTQQECTILIKKLSECKVPFQCAHGRPSVIPLTKLRPGSDSYDKDICTLNGALSDYDI